MVSSVREVQLKLQEEKNNGTGDLNVDNEESTFSFPMRKTCDSGGINCSLAVTPDLNPSSTER